MALTKVARQVLDGANVLFDMIFARQADGDDIPTHALVDTTETLIDPAVAYPQAAAIAGKYGSMAFGRVRAAAPTYTPDQLQPITIGGDGSIWTVVTAVVPTVQVSNTALQLGQGASLPTRAGPMVMSAVHATAPTYTTNTLQPLSMTTAGALRVAPSVTPATLVDKSGAITTGGTAQTAAAANTARLGFMIQNLDTANDLWFSSLATAVQSQPSFRIPPGQLFCYPPEGVPTGAISVIAPVTGQQFAAREW